MVFVPLNAKNMKFLWFFLMPRKTVNVGETSRAHLHLPPSCVILHWLGCPEALATESGRAGDRLNHPYLNSSMAAHRLCMAPAAWGHVLPQITGRQNTQNTSSENLQYTWTIVIINAPGYLQ